jgi:hypothetical protein
LQLQLGWVVRESKDEPPEDGEADRDCVGQADQDQQLVVDVGGDLDYSKERVDREEGEEGEQPRSSDVEIGPPYVGQPLRGSRPPSERKTSSMPSSLISRWFLVSLLARRKNVFRALFP